MTTDTPGASAPRGEEVVSPPLPWFGPTLYELVPGLAPGARSSAIRTTAARAITSARHDPVRQDRLRRADQASHGAVAALVAEMLTPPLPRPDPEDRP
ncbi:hypothetical protein [Streptomyces sp. NPDC090994]|uniref:hypothetical protein n=1 Tax=Streptomyces sp. NPDC090994 TaxID=3365969 RepID=UPI0037FBDEE2